MATFSVTFRVDASTVIGTGHVMRCLTLADALHEQGASCSFICRHHPGNLIDFIRSRGYDVTMLPVESPNEDSGAPGHAAWLGATWAADAAATRVILTESPADWLVVDHYAIDRRWERAVRPTAARTIVLDDLADRPHDCDILVDPGVEPDLHTRYAALTPSRCHLLVGPTYAMLRPEFERARKELARSEEPSRPKRIVVTFGGSDRDGATMAALNIIKQECPPNVAVDVIVSSVNQDANRIVEFCRLHPNYVAHRATNDIARIFASADLAVGSGGGATYERLYLRLPSILKAVAENQRAPLIRMKQMGLIDLYSTELELAEKLRAAFEKGVVLPPDVVSSGIPAICQAVTAKTVSLRVPVPDDVRDTFFWLQDDELRRQFLMREKPELRRHFGYWRRLMSDPEQRVYSIYCGEEHVGNAGIRHFGDQDRSAELWLYIGRADRRGNGAGAIALKRLERIAKKELARELATLHVLGSNEAALGLYAGAGYKRESTGQAGSPWPAEVVRLEKRL